jgi:hypothetical protein
MSIAQGTVSIRSKPAPVQDVAVPAQPQVIDNPLAPEFFTSMCSGFSIGHGHVTLTFESARCDHTRPNAPMNRVVVGRVVMPIEAAQALVIELNNCLQQSGLDPSQAATAGMVAQ